MRTNWGFFCVRNVILITEIGAKVSNNKPNKTTISAKWCPHQHYSAEKLKQTNFMYCVKLNSVIHSTTERWQVATLKEFKQNHGEAWESTNISLTNVDEDLSLVCFISKISEENIERTEIIACMLFSVPNLTEKSYIIQCTTLALAENFITTIDNGKIQPLAEKFYNKCSKTLQEKTDSFSAQPYKTYIEIQDSAIEEFMINNRTMICNIYKGGYAHQPGEDSYLLKIEHLTYDDILLLWRIFLHKNDIENNK